MHSLTVRSFGLTLHGWRATGTEGETGYCWRFMVCVGEISSSCIKRRKTFHWKCQDCNNDVPKEVVWVEVGQKPAESQYVLTAEVQG